MSLDRPHQLLSIRLANLVVDPTYQCRVAGEDPEWVDRLTDLDASARKDMGYDHGITETDPVVVFATALGNILVDGFQRVSATKKNAGAKVMARVYTGTPRDALLYTLTEANRNHGKALSDDDVRHRLRELLLDRKWRCWSDSTLAKLSGLSRRVVARTREKMLAAGEIPAEAQRPEELPPEQAEKWDEIVAGGGTPVAYERDGKPLVKDKTPRSRPESPEPSSNGRQPEPSPSSEPVVPVFTPPPPPTATLTPFEDVYGNRIPHRLRDIFVGQDSLAGRMGAESKSLAALPFPDWVASNPWLAGQSLDVTVVDHLGKKRVETWGLDRIRLWMASALATAGPKAVCRACDGDGCPVCRDKGWMPDWVYDTFDWEGEGDATAVESSGGDDPADG